MQHERVEFGGSTSTYVRGVRGESLISVSSRTISLRVEAQVQTRAASLGKAGDGERGAEGVGMAVNGYVRRRARMVHVLL